MDEQGEVLITTEPTEAEEQDLVALLSAQPARKRFGLPTKNEAGESVESPIYYIEVKPMTGSEHMRYLNVGMVYSVQPKQGAREAQVGFKTDREAQARALLEISLVDFCLPQDSGQEVRFTRADRVWQVFSKVPGPVLDWAVRMVQRFQGLEVVEPSGEA